MNVLDKETFFVTLCIVYFTSLSWIRCPLNLERICQDLYAVFSSYIIVLLPFSLLPLHLKSGFKPL